MRISFVRWLALPLASIAITGAHGQSLQKHLAGAGFTRAVNRSVSICGSFGQPLIGETGNGTSRASIGFWTSPEAGSAVSAVHQLIPDKADILSNSPNPFHDATTIRFTLAAPKNVELRVYASNGGVVSTTLLSGCPAGQNEYTFASGSLSAGAYRYSLSDGKTSIAGAMVILK